MSSKSFKHWTRQEIEENFNLQEIPPSKLLTKWLENATKITSADRAFLEGLKQKSIENITSWNEQDLIFFFISPLINQINFPSEKAKFFNNRFLKSEINGQKLNGFVDLVLASGKDEPKSPFFTLHLLKKEPNFVPDLRGQLLAKMLAMREISLNKFPIYGCYVEGRNWFFGVLDGENYSFSLGYDCTKPEIFDIFRILRSIPVSLVDNLNKS